MENPKTPDARIVFPDRESFREWLCANNDASKGIWLVFGKKGGPKTITPDQAVEEALCFG